jgi:hypothetical protein
MKEKDRKNRRKEGRETQIRKNQYKVIPGCV